MLLYQKIRIREENHTLQFRQRSYRRLKHRPVELVSSTKTQNIILKLTSKIK